LVARKEKPLAVHIVLETSALFTDAADKLIKQELSELIQDANSRGEFNVTWHLPDIVKSERKHQMTLRAYRLLPHLQKVESLLGHAFGISKEVLDERVEAAIAKEVALHKLQLRVLDASQVDWNDMVERSVQRRPPFDPGDKEKGFRDAIVLETFHQITEDLPKSPQSCRVVLISGDQLLTDAVQERVSSRSNVAVIGDLEEVRTMLNALASALTQEMIGKIVPIASAKFFASGDESTLYYKSQLGSSIATKYRDVLMSGPPTFTATVVKRVLINSPAFLAKSGQRLTFSSRITYEMEATKATWRTPAATGGLLAHIAPSGVSLTGPSSGAVTPGGLLSGLFTGTTGPGPTGPTGPSGTIGSTGPIGPAGLTGTSNYFGPSGHNSAFGSTGSIPTSGPTVWSNQPHLANPPPPPMVREEIRRAGRHIFEVTWSATLTMGSSVKNLKVEHIELKQSVWEEEP